MDIHTSDFQAKQYDDARTVTTLAPEPLTTLIDEVYETVAVDVLRNPNPVAAAVTLRAVFAEAIYAALEDTARTQAQALLIGCQRAGVRVDPTLLLELERRGERVI